MKRAELRVREQSKLLRDGAEPLVSDEVISMPPKKDVPRRARNLIVPMGAMVFTMPVALTPLATAIR